MPSSRSVVGVDLGGTRIRAGLLDAHGMFHGKAETATEAWRGPDGVLAALKDLLSRLLDSVDGSDLMGIGIAAAGQIHPTTQDVVYAPNLGWHDVPLRREIERAFGLPVWVENDVRAAAWGEFRYGAGKGAQNLIAVFVGTGVGSGAVLAGRLWRGDSNAAGEVGHTQVVPNGLPCPCGSRGCLEAYASGSGFVRRFAAALAVGTRSVLADKTEGTASRLTAVMVWEAARDEDAFARVLWDDAVRYLGLSLTNYVTLLNPERLVLGGGIMETVPDLAEAMARQVEHGATLMAKRAVKVVRASLGGWAGATGAAALLREVSPPP